MTMETAGGPIRSKQPCHVLLAHIPQALLWQSDWDEEAYLSSTTSHEARTFERRFREWIAFHYKASNVVEFSRGTGWKGRSNPLGSVSADGPATGAQELASDMGRMREFQARAEGGQSALRG